MLKCKFLYFVNFRLRQILCKFDVYFDDFNNFFYDDFDQLISIDDHVLYNDDDFSNDRLTYRIFQRIIVLKKIMRQKKQNERARFFRRTLN